MNEANRPPTYDEVIQRYGIEILKSPGDVVMKDGDFARARTGDVMLVNEEYSSMFRLVQRWRFNAPTLNFLFEQVFKTKLRRKELDDNLNAVFAPRYFDPSAIDQLQPPEIQLNRYHELNDEIGANEFGVSAYSGAVVLVLSNLLQSFREDIAATRDDWEKSAPLIEGNSIGSLLAASANNFRHNDEWARTRPPKPNQLTSIRILASAFQEKIADDGSDHRLSRDVCPETLELLSEGSFHYLSEKFFAFANNVVLRCQYRAKATIDGS